MPLAIYLLIALVLAVACILYIDYVSRKDFHDPFNVWPADHEEKWGDRLYTPPPPDEEE